MKILIEVLVVTDLVGLSYTTTKIKVRGVSLGDEVQVVVKTDVKCERKRRIKTVGPAPLMLPAK